VSPTDYEEELNIVRHFELGNTHLFLLGQGSLLNLAAGAGPFGADQFDHYTAVILLGISWMMDVMPTDIQPGMQRYPAHLEQEIAKVSLRLRG
jgi:S-adenosylhomocysteine hydrolase